MNSKADKCRPTMGYSLVDSVNAASGSKVEVALVLGENSRLQEAGDHRREETLAATKPKS